MSVRWNVSLMNENNVDSTVRTAGLETIYIITQLCKQLMYTYSHKKMNSKIF